MSFGSNIGYLRKKKGITQEELAEKMYVSRQTISRWETDSVYPDVETVIKLCELLECDMETLVRGDATQEKEHAPEQAQAHEPAAEINMVPRRNTVLRIVTDMLFPLATVVYLIIGFVWNFWHPGWLVFVIAAFLTPLLDAINRPKLRPIKKKSHIGPVVDWDRINAAFCSIVFLVAIPAYLVLGFIWNLWHPGWLIFVAATVLCGISSVLCTLVFGYIDR